MYRYSFLVLGLVVGFSNQLVAEEQSRSESHKSTGVTANYASVPEFGGPSSVGSQLKSAHKVSHKDYWFEGFSQNVQPYYDFKKKVHDDHGLSFGFDYHALYQKASKSLGEDQSSGGIIRFFGNWTLLGRDSVDKGSLVFKIENRHKLGTEIVPQQLGSEIGYAGLTSVIYSDTGSLLTNLYWQQSFKNNTISFVAGLVDATDYLNLYGLVNPWSDFNNLSFSTDPSIAAPNQGLGMALKIMMTDHLYLLGGFADANGDPAHPNDMFNTFFDEHEYFKHIEFGWISSSENRFNDNIHLTFWQVDEREKSQVPDGWGVAVSYSQLFDKRWLPFFRAAYSDGGGGSFLERSVSTGVGYYPGGGNDVLGVGLNWGRPSEKTYGARLDDQYTAELYYRFQLFPHVSITPDIQYLVNPAQNPNEDSIWVVGLGLKLTF